MACSAAGGAMACSAAGGAAAQQVVTARLAPSVVNVPHGHGNTWGAWRLRVCKDLEGVVGGEGRGAVGT